MLHMEKLISQAVEAVTSSLSQSTAEHVSPIKVPIPHHPFHLLGGPYSSQKREDMPDSLPGPPTQDPPQTSHHGGDSTTSEPSTTTNREKTFICPTCLKGFRSKQQLNQHSLVHSGIRKYECSYCDKAFKQLSHLQQHQRIHTDVLVLSAEMPSKRKRKTPITEGASLPSKKARKPHTFSKGDHVLCLLEMNVWWPGYIWGIEKNKLIVGFFNEVHNVDAYRKRCTLDEADLAMRQSLTELEKQLLDSQDLVEIRGKTGRGVPLLIPNEVKRMLDFLSDAECREKGGIKPGNGFMFGNTGDGVIRAGDALNEVKQHPKLKLDQPNRILATNLRKYTATIAQVLNLSDQEMKWVCNHLGHTMKVHDHYYRQTSGSIERIDIAKLLLLQENNIVGKYSNRKLSEVQMDDIIRDIETTEASEETLRKSEDIGCHNLGEEHSDGLLEEPRPKARREKPYRCNQEGCDRAFAQLSNLQHHLRNHDDQVKKAGNKQFKCVICHRSYTNESSLKSHTLKMHIHIKPIENPDDLNSHIKQRRKKSKSENLYNAPTMVPSHDQNHDRGLGSFPLALGLQERNRLDSSTHSSLLGLGGIGHSPESMRHDRMVQSPGLDGHRHPDKHSPGSDKIMSGSGSVSFIELDDSGEVVSASVNRASSHGLSLDQNHNIGLERGGSLSQIMDRTNAHLLNRSTSHLGFDRRNLQSLSRGLNLVSQGMRLPESSVSSSSYQGSTCTTTAKQEYSSPLSPSSHSPISHHSDRLFSQSVHALDRSLSSPYSHMSLPTDRNPYPAHVNNISLPMDTMSLPVSTHHGRQFHSQMPLSPRMPPMLPLPTSSHMTLPTTPQRLTDSMSFSPLGN